MIQNETNIDRRREMKLFNTLSLKVCWAKPKSSKEHCFKDFYCSGKRSNVIAFSWQLPIFTAAAVPLLSFS